MFPSPTKLLVSELSRIFCHMDVGVFMNMDESPKSSKDACMVESVLSQRGDGKRQSCIGDIIVMICLTLIMQCDKMISGRNTGTFETCNMSDFENCP